MPPTTKPQTKKKEAEEGKGKKAVAVTALLLYVALAAFAAAQNATGGMPEPKAALSGFLQILKYVVLGVRLTIAMAFWGAIAIMVYHVAMGKIAPTRFQRVGAFWDALERAKDVVISFAWLFLLIFAIYAAIGIIVNGGQMDVNTAVSVVKWIMVDPITELFNYLHQ